MNFYRRAMIGIGEAIGIIICEPQLRIGRFRHDGRCDECSGRIADYAAEKLVFPTSRESEQLTAIEKMRVMSRASYRLVCFACYCSETAEVPDDE